MHIELIGAVNETSLEDKLRKAEKTWGQAADALKEANEAVVTAEPADAEASAAAKKAVDAAAEEKERIAKQKEANGDCQPIEQAERAWEGAAACHYHLQLLV